MLRRALIQCFEVIGEAATHVTPATRARLSEVPWRSIRGMRNLIAHAYYAVNLDTLWGTANNDVGPLVEALERALSAEAT